MACVLIGAFGVAPASARGNNPDRHWGEAGGDVGFGTLGPDLFTTFQVGVHLQEGALSLGLEAALRVRTVDREGQQPSHVRQEDWDEPSDYAHVIRYLTYRRDFRRVKLGLMLGELSLVDLGHGSLVSGYTSVVDIDHPHSGFRGRVVNKWFQADVMVDDFVKPEILSIRMQVHPGLPNLGIGVSSVLDVKAPVTVLVDDDGLRQVSRTRHLQVDSRVLGFVGLDLEYRIRLGRTVQLVPYTDANWAVGSGFGVHLGLSARFNPGAGRWTLSSGAEYQLSLDGYVPSYVDLFYDIQRFQVALGRSFEHRPVAARTKLAVMMEREGLDHGSRWWAKVELRRKFWLRAVYELRPGIVGDTVLAELGLPLGRRFTFAAVAARTGLVDRRDWKTADGTLASSELRVRAWKYLYILAQLGYLYVLGDDGVYQGVLMVNAGVGGSWGY